jgi:glucosylceramidase
VSYYIIAHASKFIPAGSIRIETGTVDNLSCVAFHSPSGKKILIVLNESMETEMFNIKLNGNWILTSMLPSSVSTFVL